MIVTNTEKDGVLTFTLEEPFEGQRGLSVSSGPLPPNAEPTPDELKVLQAIRLREVEAGLEARVWVKRGELAGYSFGWWRPGKRVNVLTDEIGVLTTMIGALNARIEALEKKA